MPLETLSHQDDYINIKKLSLDSVEAKREPHFLAERDLTEADWEKMFQRFHEARDRGEWGSFTTRASRLTILDSKKMSSEISGDDWVNMKKTFETFRTSGGLVFAYEAAELMSIDSDITLSLISAEDWKEMIDGLKKKRQSGDWTDFTFRASCLATIDRTKVLPLITETDWQMMVAILKNYPKEKNWTSFIALTSQLVTLDAPRTLSLISENDWQEMIEVFHNIQNQDDSGEALERYASHLTIISRAEMEVNGVNPESPTSPFPTVRNF